MAIRKFLASTTREAMMQVRRELGDDAVIIANRRIGNRIEILAAAPDAVDALVERSETRAMPAMRDERLAPRADAKPKVEAFQDFVRRQMQADAEGAAAPRAPAARNQVAKTPAAQRSLAGNSGVAMYHDVADIEAEEFIAQPVRASERAPQRATAADLAPRRAAADPRANVDELVSPAATSARAQATTLPHSHRAQQIETAANAGDPAVFRRRPAQLAAQPRNHAAAPTRASAGAPKVDILLEAHPAEAAHPLAQEPAPRLAPASEAAPIATGHAVVPTMPVRSQAAPIAIAARLREAWVDAAAELAAKQAAPAAPVAEAAKASDAQSRVSDAEPATAAAPAPQAAAPSFATWSWQAQFIPARVVPQVVAPAPLQPVAQQAIAPVAQQAAAVSVQNAVAPVAPQVVAPVAQQAVAPVAPQVAPTAVQQTAAPVAQQATAPAQRQTGAPVAQQGIAQVAPQIATPVAQPPATPVAEQTPACIARQADAPVASQTAAPAAQQAAAPTSQHVVAAPQPVAETAAQSTTSVAPQPASPANPSSAPQPAQPPVESQLLAELHSMRDMLRQQIASLASKPASEPVSATPAATRVMTRLLTAGFSAEVARRIASHAPQHAEAAQTQEWLQEVLAHNIRCVDAADGIVERAGRPATPGQIFALVGPTGVGKTTTVAKLAARFAVRHGTSALGLITLDSYRVAAPEQLRAFGRILGTPVHLAQDAATLRELLATMVHKRLVLIDTCGVSQRDDRLGEMLDLLASAGTGSRPVQRVLLMNSASHVETLEETARAWRAQECVGTILTKLDEATRIGGSLDVSLRHRLALLGLTNGQRVPEDWHAANGKLLAHLALKPAAQLFELAQEEGAALIQAQAAGTATQGTAHA